MKDSQTIKTKNNQTIPMKKRQWTIHFETRTIKSKANYVVPRKCQQIIFLSLLRIKVYQEYQETGSIQLFRNGLEKKVLNRRKEICFRDGYRVLRRVSSRRGGNFPGGTCGEEDYESRGSCGGRKRMREGQGKADGRKGRTPTYGAISHRECLTGPVLTPETLVRAVLMNTLNMGVVRSASSETLSSHEESHYPVGISSSDAWTLSLSFLSVGVLISAAMALVLLTAVSYQCAATWRWLRTTIIGSDSEASISPTNPSSKTSVMISHSLPDLQSEPAKEEYVQEKETKKVLRQTTLPTVPVRHQTFQRQLSHHLHIPSIQFSICRLEDKSESNLGLIKPELYQLEMERARSSDSSAAVDLEYAGKLHFSLRYDPDIEGLVLKIFEARDLPVKDITGSSDPYIKVYLLPDRKKKFQTKVHRKNLNPVFNETFIFSVNHEDLHQRYLQFSVYDFDRFSRHDLIGQVVLKGLLDTTDLHKEVEYTMTILSPPQEKKHLGELMLSLCYLPTAGRLTLTVVKARNLKAMDITGKSDPYVKIYLLCEGKRMKKKKTTIKKSTLSPVYNEAFVFDVPAENIEDVCLVVKVLDHDRIGSNELLGCTGIGNDFIGVGRDHWLEMLDNPRKPVAQWYPLLDSLPGNFLVEPEPLTVSLGCLNSKERSASPS